VCSEELSDYVASRIVFNTVGLRSSRLFGGRAGPNYPGIRTTEGKLRGIGNIQKVIVQ
jgi:hypothetical protein